MGDEIAQSALLVDEVMLEYPEPTSIEEALATPDSNEWRQAIDEELDL